MNNLLNKREVSVKSHKHRKPINWWRVSFLLMCVLIPLINFAVFYIYVNINSFLMGFQMNVNGQKVWTIAHFTRFFQEFRNPTSEIGLAFINTFKSFAIQMIMFPISFLVSYFLYKKIFMYKFFRTAFFLPSLISAAVITAVFTRFVSVAGPIAKIVQNVLKLDYVPSLLGEERFANKVIFAHMIWLAFPGSMVLWSGTFSRIPDSVIESARLDGVNWLQEAVRIIIPIVWPTFTLQLMMSVVGVFNASGAVFLFTKGQKGTMTLSCWTYLQVYNNIGGDKYSNAYNYLSAVGLLITAASIILALIVHKITGTKFKEVQY